MRGFLIQPIVYFKENHFEGLVRFPILLATDQIASVFFSDSDQAKEQSINNSTLLAVQNSSLITQWLVLVLWRVNSGYA